MIALPLRAARAASCLAPLVLCPAMRSLRSACLSRTLPLGDLSAALLADWPAILPSDCAPTTSAASPAAVTSSPFKAEEVALPAASDATSAPTFTKALTRCRFATCLASPKPAALVRPATTMSLVSKPSRAPTLISIACTPISCATPTRPVRRNSTLGSALFSGSLRV